MLNWLKNKLGITSLEEKADISAEEINTIGGILVKTPEVELLRHLLGSIDLSDIKQPKLTESEHKEKVARYAGIYKDVIEKDTPLLLEPQRDWIATEIMNQDQLMFGRGTINGIFLYHEYFKKFYLEQLANFQEQQEKVKPFDREKVIAELTPNE